MQDKLKEFLSQYKLSKISVLQLAEQCPTLQYEQFAQLILGFEQQQILLPVKSSSMNGKQPALANSYKINKAIARQDVREQIKQLKKTFHPAIWIEYYLTKTSQQLQQDLPALLLLNDYLLKKSLPKTKALAQERSFEIFHDEKYITDQGGKKLLERVKIWDLLEIWPIADPVSFAINPIALQNEVHKLLIVENKATFYSLLPALRDGDFTALLYGQGNAINGTIQVLQDQLPLDYEQVRFYYFGDVDAEGISIWFLLRQKINVVPALPFYKACLQQVAAKGKDYQQQNPAAIEAFLAYFDPQEQQQINQLLVNGCYYPQEALKAHELQHIWRHWLWT
ncbi:Wadjet anti-phage system protein JetD domain-containing protein [Lysinibacillus sp. LZ02]|uniref:Wadjet anti-phage system protein JetD domain-containing protein n=1 Tax=Lysinibacillus sp. LZ02 TaxID=3420668 RepID=UPI003D36C06A